VNYIEKSLDKRPVLTIVVIAAVTMAVVTGLGGLPWITNWTARGKAWVMAKFKGATA
jgi:hypothetical protein